MPEKGKSTAKKPTARKTVAKKTVARKTVAKKPTARKPTARKPTAKKPTAKKPTAKKPLTSRSAMHPRAGDLIVIDSPKVGSPPREGEVLEVIQGQVSVSYRVQWADGHQTLIAPLLGSARIIPAVGNS